MNSWTKKSGDLAYQEGYLDNLLDIYPIKSNPIREMPESIRTQIKNAYEKKDHKLLIKTLNIGVKRDNLKFPVECYYASSLRNEPNWIDLNPKIVNAMANLILDLDLDMIYDHCIAPKKVSRQAGPMFTDWFKNKFSADKDIIIIGSSDNERKTLAKGLIQYNSSKGLDLFIQINKIHIIGESKFITDSGGTQANQFKSALSITQTFKKKINVIPLSIIDGHCWRKSNDQFYTTIKNSKDDHIIISALLLEDLFEKVKQLEVPTEGLGNIDIIDLIS